LIRVKAMSGTALRVPDKDHCLRSVSLLLPAALLGLTPLVGTAWIAVIRGRIQRDQPKAQRGVDAAVDVLCRA